MANSKPYWLLQSMWFWGRLYMTQTKANLEATSQLWLGYFDTIHKNCHTKQLWFWTNLFLPESWSVANDCDITGLTRSVNWQSAVSASWNVKLALQPPVPPPTPSGQLNVVPTELCSAGSGKHSRPVRSILSILPHDNSGDTSMHWWAVVEFRGYWCCGVPATFRCESGRHLHLTANTPSPSFLSVPSGCTFANFQPLTVNDVTAAMWLLPDKHCASDPIPTSLLKDCTDVLAPFLVELYNKSLRTGSVPGSVQGSQYNATVEEVWLGSGRCALLSADIQLVSHIQTARAPCRLSSFWTVLLRQNSCLNYSWLTKHITP